MNWLNEGGIDRVIRVVIGLTLLVLGFGGFVGGTLGLVFKIVGFIPLITGLVGFCPLYSLFRINTLGKKPVGN